MSTFDEDVRNIRIDYADQPHTLKALENALSISRNIAWPTAVTITVDSITGTVYIDTDFIRHSEWCSAEFGVNEVHVFVDYKGRMHAYLAETSIADFDLEGLQDALDKIILGE